MSEGDMTARYERAAGLLQGMWSRKFSNSLVFPHWIAGTACFWYTRERKDGLEFRIVNATNLGNKLAFDHSALATALAEVSTEEVNARELPIRNVDVILSPLQVRFTAFGRAWLFDAAAGTCTEREVHSGDWLLSPDGRYAAFAQDHNLWVRELKTGAERALTSDGEAFFVYGATGEAWGHPVDSGLQVKWSPDSRKIFAVQRDTRQVKTLPVVQHVPEDGSLRPTVKHYKIAYPGDEHVPEYRLLVIEVESGRTQDAHYRRIPVVRNGWGYFNAGLGWWATDSRRAYFVDQERGDQVVRVVEFDTETGATRILFEEHCDTHINLSANSEDYPCFVSLPETRELIWWSERSGWAHLYLYDLETGELKHPITQGEWLVREVVEFDAERRELFIQTAGRVPGRDPYYRDLCRVQVDTGELTPLTDSDHEYLIAHEKSNVIYGMASGFGLDTGKDVATGVDENFSYIVVTKSRADQVPQSLLLDREGTVLLEIETTDISALPDGWQWPEPVKLVAADGKTDLYGLVFRPSDFSPNKSYPVLSHVFSTADATWVAKGSFNNGTFLGYSFFDAAALAELGFIVVQLDGRGTFYRHRDFRDEMYGWVASVDNPADHVAGLQQLAERHSYIDLSRAGVFSPQAGIGGILGMLEHPDFYKVGVNMCAIDSRTTTATLWGDKYEGVAGPEPGHKYPEELADRLAGRLLLMHGMLDMACPAAATFRIVEALQQANKDFDLLLLPTLGHMPSSYATRRSWDYMVTHLLDLTPPKEFRLTSGTDFL